MLRKGAAYEHACQYAGISYQSFRNWIEAGESATRGRYFEFVEAVRSAEAEAVKKWLDVIETAAVQVGNYKPALEMLSRRYPNEYGKQVIEQQNSGEVKIRVEYADPHSNAS